MLEAPPMTTFTTRAPVALITGSSQGLGLAIAREYAARGVGLILTARHARQLEQVARKLAHTAPVIAMPGDVSDSVHLQRLVETAEARFGRIDVLINNASELGPS